MDLSPAESLDDITLHAKWSFGSKSEAEKPELNHAQVTES